jgi:hypothetical protein
MQDSNLSLADFGASSPRLHLRLRAVQVKAGAPAPQNSVEIILQFVRLVRLSVCPQFARSPK